MSLSGWIALRRKLKTVLSPAEYKEWRSFLRQINGRYTGNGFEKLTADELNTLSTWATRACVEAASSGVER